MSRPPLAWAPPIFRWAGSKRKLIPTLLRGVPASFKTYFEPFVGSACFFFALRPNSAVLGDINQELIEAFSVLRHHPRLLHRATTAHELDESGYYKLRDDAVVSTPMEQAARFFALNRACFNGLYRTNRDGDFNVPYGRKTGTLPPSSMFYRASVALRGAKLKAGDFSQTLRSVRAEDFVYLDPPYVYSDRKDRGEYGVGCFGLGDLDRLFQCLIDLDARNAYFLLSYLESDEILERAAGWHIHSVPVKRQISGFAKFRRCVNEVLISNYPAFVA